MQKRSTILPLLLAGLTLAAEPAVARQDRIPYTPPPDLYERLVRGCDPVGGGAEFLPLCEELARPSRLCDSAPVVGPSSIGLPPCRDIQWNANVCDVEMHAAVDFTYDQGRLPAIMYFGRHNMTPDARYANFRIIDDDGFLTLLMVFLDLRQSGQFPRHLQVDGANLYDDQRTLLLRAAEIGETYSRALMARADALPEGQRTAAVLEARENAARDLAEWQSLRESLETLPITLTFEQTGFRWFSMPRGFLSRWTRRLEDFFEGEGSPSYGDAATGQRSRLCDPDAPSALIGRALCAIDFNTGYLRSGHCEEPDEERIALMLAARPYMPARSSEGMIVRFRWRPPADLVPLAALLYCQARPGSAPMVIQSCSGMNARRYVQVVRD